jgi:hypothetical protein
MAVGALDLPADVRRRLEAADRAFFTRQRGPRE